MYKATALLVLLFAFLTAQSQTKRAFVVGINSYTPPQGTVVSLDNRLLFADLEGARNDATAFAAILINRYHFNTTNVVTLFDRDATRDSLLSGLNNLLSSSDTNDIAVFFYAGHGSQVRNSLSSEPDQKDESIVPADAWKRDSMDITDKELNRIFNQFIDKKVKLTVIFDCCHAGSLSRAVFFKPLKSRSISISPGDRKDNSTLIAPERRPADYFLILSAAQDNELALEQMDENNIVHGSFTSALLQAINQQPVNSSAANIFTSARAILKVNGKRQEPVMAARKSRQQQTLFGTIPADESEKLLIPITMISRNRVELQAGYANGIQKYNELLSTGNDSTLLRIDTILSLTKSIATVVKGDVSLLKGGGLFDIVNWVSSGKKALKIYLDTTSIGFADHQKLIDLNLQLRKSLGTQWIGPADKRDPQVLMTFTKSSCVLIDNKGRLGIANYTVSSILKAIGKRTVAVNLPLPSSAIEYLREQLPIKTGAIIVTQATAADYFVTGTVNNRRHAVYSLTRMLASISDSLAAMPTTTKGITLDKESELAEFSNSLITLTRTLTKIKGWLTLSGPADLTQFPYHLELRNLRTGLRIDTSFARIDDEVGLHLILNPNSKNISIPQKYIYSFSIDRNGKMTLIYPDEEMGSVENKMPRYKGRYIEPDVLLRTFSIAEPVGTDTYFLIACDEPIQNYSILLNQEGTRNMFPSRPSNPIAELLNIGNEGESRGLKKTAVNWILLKMPVQSRY